MIEVPASRLGPEAAMAWTRPSYSRDEVLAVGETFRRLENGGQPLTLEEYHAAMQVLNNWRAAHNYPLNALHMNLRNHARRATVSSEPLTVQRIKRLQAILHKLRTNRRVNLVNMQDIGGCRGIVDTLTQAYATRDRFVNSKARHVLARENDYIRGGPNRRGYRGLHLIYNYHGGDELFDDMPIEIQIRTKLQHMWATANEVAGLMRGEQFKSGEGDPKWIRMFALLGSVFALEEGTCTAPGTPDNVPELRREMREWDAELRFTESVERFAYGFEFILSNESRQLGENRHYYLLKLSLASKKLTVTSYRAGEQTRAEQDLAEVEGEISKGGTGGITDAVLVTAPDLKGLKRAYPNYNLDTTSFIRRVKKVLA